MCLTKGDASLALNVFLESRLILNSTQNHVFSSGIWLTGAAQLDSAWTVSRYSPYTQGAPLVCSDCSVIDITPSVYFAVLLHFQV